MADNVPVTAGSGTNIATDDIAGVHYQRVKLADGTADSATVIAAGGGTEATALRVTLASDSTGLVSVDDNGAALTVDNGGTFAVQDSQAVADNAGFTDGTTKLFMAGYIYDDTAGTALTENDAAAPRVSANRATVAAIEDGATRGRYAGVVDETGTNAVDALATGGGTPHDSVDSGNPVKVGAKAVSALPTAVAANDRANNISDLWGRQLVAHIDPAMQVWKSVNVTSTQTGSDVWTPGSGKKIAITYLSIASYGTTAGRVILWFGANADTTYSAGTDQLIWAGSFAPSATSKPGAIIPLPHPIFAVTADHEIHLTTDAAISLDITVYGYEF